MESHKLDLMAEVAELRLRLQTTETERLQFKDKYERLQVCTKVVDDAKSSLENYGRLRALHVSLIALS